MKAISSRDNPLVKQVRALSNSARDRKKLGKTVFDGDHLLSAALAAGIVPEAVLVSPQGLSRAEIREVVAAADECCPVYELPDELLAQCSPVSTSAGVVTLMSPTLPDSLPDRGDVILLEQVQDAGNLGTLMRTACASGIRQVLMTEGCAQAWSPKVLRAGMGAHFNCSIHENVDAEAWLSEYQGDVLATALSPKATSIYQADLRNSSVWLFGSEGAGLSDALMARATQHLIIPMAGQMESLNVAAAAAVCLFEQVRQRRA